MTIKTFNRCSLLCLLGAFIISASAGVEAPYEVGTWGNFAKGAVSFTFDDNTGNQLTIAQPMFDKFGFHMTMFVVVNWVGDNLGTYSDAFKAGHEIGSHSMTHNGNPVSASELGPSQEAIKKAIPGEMAVTIAYPNCTSPGDNEVKKYYIAGRVCGGQMNSKTPANFMGINGIFCGNGNSLGGASVINTTQGLIGVADQASSQGGWGVYLLHGVGQEPSQYSNCSPVNSDALKGCLESLDKNRNTVWVETFGNVARYIIERNAVSIAKKDSSEKGITISVTDTKPDSIFNFPLSIRRPLPEGWTTAVVTQKGKQVSDTIVTVNSKKYVMFQAVPDGGDVLISQIATKIIKPASGLGFDESMPVKRLHSAIVVDPSRFTGSRLNVTLFNLSGKELARYSFGSKESDISVPIGKIGNSAFLVKVAGGGKSYVGTFLPQL
jgi:hypothetical protein